MDCVHCDERIDKRSEYFEVHQHQAGPNPILQHTFCCPECLCAHVSA